MAQRLSDLVERSAVMRETAKSVRGGSALANVTTHADLVFRIMLTLRTVFLRADALFWIVAAHVRSVGMVHVLQRIVGNASVRAGSACVRRQDNAVPMALVSITVLMGNAVTVLAVQTGIAA